MVYFVSPHYTLNTGLYINFPSGIWLSDNEGAKFWLSVLTELKNRGVKDIIICCIDGLRSFAEAIETVFPKASVQLCIVHIVRNSLRYVSMKDMKAVASDLKEIYHSPTEKWWSKYWISSHSDGRVNIRV